MEFTSSQLQAMFLSRHRWQAVVYVKSHNNNHTQDTDLAFDLLLYKREHFKVFDHCLETLTLNVGAEVTAKGKRKVTDTINFQSIELNFIQFMNAIFKRNNFLSVYFVSVYFRAQLNAHVVWTTSQ